MPLRDESILADFNGSSCVAPSRGAPLPEEMTMKHSTHYIEREVGRFVDNLIMLWEGNDLPTFSRREPYFFDDLPVAERVAQRLAARYPETSPIPGVAAAMPITYRIRTVEWDDASCPCCGSDTHCSQQHLSQFI